jgi:hypothetical protein
MNRPIRQEKNVLGAKRRVVGQHRRSRRDNVIYASFQASVSPARRGTMPESSI